MKSKIIRIAAISVAMALNCWPVKADDTVIKVFPFDGDAEDETITYPATDLNRPDIPDSDVNTDKNVPGIQVRTFDSNYTILAYPKGKYNRIDDLIQYQGTPITLSLTGIRSLNSQAYRLIDEGDADEKGAGAVFNVTGPHVEKKLVSGAHDTVVKEYMGYIGREYEAEGEFDTAEYGAYTMEMLLASGENGQKMTGDTGQYQPGENGH